MDDKSNAPQEKTVTAYKGFDMNFRFRDFQFESEIGLSELVQAAVAYTVGRCIPCDEQDTTLTTGNRGASSATGYCVAASATGNRGAASATGHYGAASATGNRGAASATGKQSTASATGDWGSASVNNANSVASATGYQGVARAGVGGAICLCHRLDDGTLTHIRASKVGENGIKPDTWYRLSATGEFVEVGHASNAP